MNFFKKKTTINIEVDHNYDSLEKLLTELSKYVKENKEEFCHNDTFEGIILQGKSKITHKKNEEILDLKKTEQRDFEVLQDIKCNDSCYNRPSKVILPKGSKVTISGNARNGDIFAQTSDKKYVISANREAVKSRCPYDVGLLNLNYFKPIV